MRTVFLVPRREDGGQRDKLWEWCRQRWQQLFPAILIYEGHHAAAEGLFNRSRAINRAAALADQDGRWDYAIVIDGDVFLRQSQVATAINWAATTGHVTWAHRRWRGLSQEATTRVLNPRNPHDFGPECDRDDMDLWIEKTTPISWSCCQVIPRAVWDSIGGFDERFEGWGWDDMAFKALVTGLYGWKRVRGDVYHLWHPRSEERIVKGQPATTASREYVANARLGRRYMVACIRDHGIGDQPSEEHLSAEMREKHVANLKRDDVKLKMLADRFGMPNWDQWWPTLEELRDGAREYRQVASERAQTITLVVHTGGDPDNWAERSGYLRRSLASLAKQVTGKIVQRVIYSDWGPDHLEELQAIGEPLGFYVAGEGHHGYTVSMQRMWRYLAKRGKGDYVFRVEDDFLYERPVDLAAMIAQLEAHPHLAQLALLRGPAYPREFERGGVLGWPEESFAKIDGHLEHTNFWTNNPALFRRSLTEVPWPSGPSSERLFGDALLRDPSVRFGLLGAGESWIHHIGEVRAGSSY